MQSEKAALCDHRWGGQSWRTLAKDLYGIENITCICAENPDMDGADITGILIEQNKKLMKKQGGFDYVDKKGTERKRQGCL